MTEMTQNDTEFEIKTREFWGRARYLSVTEASQNTCGWEGTFLFLSNRRDRETNPELKREKQRS